MLTSGREKIKSRMGVGGVEEQDNSWSKPGENLGPSTECRRSLGEILTHPWVFSISFLMGWDGGKLVLSREKQNLHYSSRVNIDCQLDRPSNYLREEFSGHKIFLWRIPWSLIFSLFNQFWKPQLLWSEPLCGRKPIKGNTQLLSLWDNSWKITVL